MYPIKSYQNTSNSMLPEQSVINLGVKMFGMVDPEAWVCLRSGDWSDSKIWQKNGFQTNKVPNSNNANVTINKGVTVRINQSATINNFTSYGAITYDTSSRTLTINNNCFIYGTLTFGGASFDRILLGGVNNYINPLGFTAGANGIVRYSRSGDQNILNLPYNAIEITGSGVKKLTSDLTLAGYFQGNSGTAILDLGNYNFTCTGTFLHFNTMIKTGTSGNTILVGSILTLNCNIGSNNIEVRGGMSATATQSITCGTITATTNNQTWTSTGNATFTCNVTVDNSITVTNSFTAATITITGVLNGNNASSTWDNRGFIVLSNSADVMATGVFNANSAANRVTLSAQGSVNIRHPNDTTYRDLVLSISQGSGIPVNTYTFTGNTTVSGTLDAGSKSIIELGGNNISFNNLIRGTLLGSQTDILIKKSINSGTTVINGTFGYTATYIRIALQTGTNNIDFYGNIKIAPTTNGAFTWSGTGNITIKASLSLDFDSGTIPHNFVIDNGITLTNTSTSIGVTLSNALNGNNATSKWDNRGILTITFDGALMSTGIFNADQATNTVTYNKTGLLQVIRDPDDGNYKNLTLTGNTSTKTVGGDGTTNVRGTYTVNAGVTVVGVITNLP